MKTNGIVAACVLAVSMAGAGLAEQWSFDVQPGERLEIDLETGGTIEIRGMAGTQVRVVADVRGRDAETVRVKAERTNRGVRVESEQTAHQRKSSASVDLEIELPSRYDVALNSMGGSITIRGVEGDLSGETMGGELVLEGVRGTIDLSTMGGSIEVSDAVASGKVSTMGGNVVLRDVRGGLRGSTMGGNVKIEGGDAGSYRSEGPNRRPSAQSGDVVRISSMGGAIDVASAPNGADVETMGGNVRVRSVAKFVKASTMGGNVDIQEADGDVDASSMGGDVTVRIVGDGGDVVLESLSGTIELTLPASFSGAFDVELAFTKDSRRNYEIRSDFPLSQRRDEEWRYGKGSPRKTVFGTGRSGGGEHKVKIRTINGDVVIRKGE